jgi:hypothetical protein
MYILAGFEPGLFVHQADAMTTAPRRPGLVTTYRVTRDRCYYFLNFSPKNFAKMAFLTQNKAKF